MEVCDIKRCAQQVADCRIGAVDKRPACPSGEKGAVGLADECIGAVLSARDTLVESLFEPSERLVGACASIWVSGEYPALDSKIWAYHDWDIGDPPASARMSVHMTAHEQSTPSIISDHPPAPPEAADPGDRDSRAWLDPGAYGAQ